MDPVTLAGATVGLLVPYLKQLAGGVVNATGDQLGAAAATALGRVLAALKMRFGKDQDKHAEKQLQDMSARPGDTRHQHRLENALVEVIQDDPGFAADLERLVTEAQRVTGWQAAVGSAEGTIAIGGNVRQQADYLAGRDMTINQASPPGAEG